MHPEPIQKTPKRPFAAVESFPWRCRQCGKTEVVMSTTEYNAEVRHDGRLHRYTIPRLEIPICQACGEMVFTEDVDLQVNDALCMHLHMLTPEQIEAGIKRVGMSQKEVAGRLGVAEATLSSWLNKMQLQSRAMDNLLRTFFAFPQVRAVLCGKVQDPELGISDIVSNAR